MGLAARLVLVLVLVLHQLAWSPCLSAHPSSSRTASSVVSACALSLDELTVARADPDSSATAIALAIPCERTGYITVLPDGTEFESNSVDWTIRHTNETVGIASVFISPSQPPACPTSEANQLLKDLDIGRYEAEPFTWTWASSSVSWIDGVEGPVSWSAHASWDVGIVAAACPYQGSTETSIFTIEAKEREVFNPIFLAIAAPFALAFIMTLSWHLLNPRGLIARCRQRAPPSKGVQHRTLCLAVLPRDGRVVSGATDNALYVWNVSERAAAGSALRGHSDWVTCVAVLGDGASLRAAQLGDAARSDDLAVRRVAAARGDLVLSGSNDATLRVWDLATAECVRVITGHTAGVTAVAALQQGSLHCVSTSEDGTLRVWNWLTGDNAFVIPAHVGWVCDLSVLGDSRVVTCGFDRAMRVWALDSASSASPTHPACVMSGHTDIVTCCDALPDRLHVVSGSADASVRVWRLADAQCVSMLRGHTNTVSCVVALPDSRIASASRDMSVRVWSDVLSDTPSVLIIPRTSAIPSMTLTSGRGRSVLVLGSVRRHQLRLVKTPAPEDLRIVSVADALQAAAAAKERETAARRSAALSINSVPRLVASDAEDAAAGVAKLPVAVDRDSLSSDDDHTFGEEGSDDDDGGRGAAQLV